jgi:hypothetical protein
MICSYCKSNVDTDSFHCDQCGKEIFICSECGLPGKGKNCIYDGKKLISTKDKYQPNAIDSDNIKVEKPSPPFSLFDSSSDFSNSHSEEKNKKYLPIPILRLVNKNLKIDIEIKNEDIIGRIEGMHVNVFSQFNQISGKHGQFIFDTDKGWTYKDVGSTNGSKYSKNDIWSEVSIIKQHTSEVLANNYFLLLANIEFQIVIEINPNKGGTIKV